jgi:deoxyribonuclease V
MRYDISEWQGSHLEAIALQKELAVQIVTEDTFSHVSFIAGVDAAFSDSGTMIHAAIVIMTYPALEIVEMHCHQEALTMPYIPGLLSFREMPSLLSVFKKVKQKPDLIMVDGMGIAHPRGIGIASHLGLCLHIPTIGVAKKKLVGIYNEDALNKEFGSTVPLLYRKKQVGMVVRTKKNVKPLFISPGHLISIETSVMYTLACAKGYRLVEPTRLADRLSKKHSTMHGDQCY